MISISADHQNSQVTSRECQLSGPSSIAGEQLGSTKRLTLVPILLLTVLAFVLSAPLFSFKAWPHSHEYLRYPFVTDQVADGWRHGHPYPRFLPNACGGYGYPTFVFYPPAFFLLSAPISCLTGSTLFSLYAVVTLSFWLGGLGAYQLSRLFVGDYKLAFLCALVYLLTPYLYTDSLVRGDLTEFLATTLLPWPIYFLFSPSPSLLRRVLLSLSVAAITCAHPLIAMPYLPLLATIILFVPSTTRRSQICDGLAFLTGMAIASPYWLPLVLLRRLVSSDGAFDGYFRFENHFVAWWKFFSRHWGYAGSNATDGNAMSFQLGLPHALVAFAGVCVSARKSRLTQVCTVWYVALLFMMTEPSLPVWNTVPLLRTMQFPWRLLAVTSVCQVILIAQAVAYLNKFSPAICRITLISLTIAMVPWYWPMYFANPAWMERASEVVAAHRSNWLNVTDTYAGANEFTPKTAMKLLTAPPLGDRAVLESEDASQVTFAGDSSRYDIHAKIEMQRPGEVILNQMYLPGWRFVLDGQSIPRKELEAALMDDGRIRVKVTTAGEHEIKASYASPPGEIEGIALALCMLLGLCGYHFYVRALESQPNGLHETAA